MNCPSTDFSLTAPGDVTDLTVSEITKTSMKVSWKDTGDSSYRVDIWSDGIKNKNESVSSNTTELTYLTPGTQYTINVTAVASDLAQGLPATKTVYTSKCTFMFVFNCIHVL